MTYDIKIEEVFNGYIVTIGCQRIVMEGRSSMEHARQRLMTELEAYLVDPHGTEKAWRERFGRKKEETSEHRHSVHSLQQVESHNHG